MHGIKFFSKADTAIALSSHKFLNIPKSFSFTVREWHSKRHDFLQKIMQFFAHEDLLAVRSSCHQEDSELMSAAGAYLSVLNVPSSDAHAIHTAVDKVIASYGESSPEDQVLIQTMIRNVTVTGVMMTRVLTDGAPYYVINYDDESGKTDTITGGCSTSKTVYVYRDVRDSDFDSQRLRSFVKLARCLEKICANDALDIEFCLDINNVLYLLQVRPICTRQQWSKNSNNRIDCIEQLSDFITTATGPSHLLFGQRSILGVMPDWNPAEMIGVLPRPLASSLYRNLITARVWSTSRKRMGYQAVSAIDLMLLVMGRPYIDVRASFNSFLPEGLTAVTSEALVSAWLDRLEDQPQLHDKIEFEIAQTALDFCFDAHLDDRYPGLLTASRREEFRSCLWRLTALCLDNSPSGSLKQAFDAITELCNRQAGRVQITPESPPPLPDINPLLEECRKYGTLPFSILARHAFIAESLLRTAVVRGALRPERLQDFKASIRTVSSELSAEFLEVCMGQRDSVGFMRKYGHLRPSSYDILSPRYADRKNLFGDAALSLAKPTMTRFEITLTEQQNIQALLTESRLPTTPKQLLDYARRAILGRELAKFVFSRNLSDILETVAYWGERIGFSREDTSFLDIQTILEWITNVKPIDSQKYFSEHITRNKELLAKSANIKLGYLIRSSKDIYIAPQHRAAPNFTGTHPALGPVLRLYADSPCDVDLAGRIVCIENADPGFDWIFTRQIGGLVTKFGGTNSHMAIRCAEYDLPAAIGVGEQLFTLIANAETALVDPQAAVLKPCCWME